MARTTAEESERVRQAILQETANEIAEVGYAGLRVPNVAKRIGKTQGAVYTRYSTKEALAIDAVRMLRDEVLLPKVMAAMNGAASPLGKVSAMSRALADAATENPAGQLMMARLATEVAGRDDPLAREVQSLFATFSEVLQGLFELAASQGTLHSSLEPDRLARAVVGLPIAFATMAATFGQAEYAELEATLALVLDRGVAVDD